MHLFFLPAVRALAHDREGQVSASARFIPFWVAATLAALYVAKTITDGTSSGAISRAFPMDGAKLRALGPLSLRVHPLYISH